MFICVIPIFIFLALWIYRSRPWKEAVYQNKALFILLIVNFLLMFVLFFGTGWLGFLDVVQIDNGVTGVCLGFMLACAVLSGLFNYKVEREKFHENSTRKAKNTESHS